eukprot:symbB.v1.2.013740.t1/scaffold978.1/size277179/1
MPMLACAVEDHWHLTLPSIGTIGAGKSRVGHHFFSFSEHSQQSPDVTREIVGSGKGLVFWGGGFWETYLEDHPI